MNETTQQAPFTVESAMGMTQQSGNVYAEQKLKEAALAQKEQQLAGAEQQLAMAGRQMAAEKAGMNNVLAALSQGAGGLGGMQPQGLGNAAGMEMQIMDYLDKGGNPADMPVEAQQYLAQMAQQTA